MRLSRLQRLSRLSQGLALVGLGVSAPACGNSAPTQEPPRDGNLHINAPPTPAVSASAPTASSAAPVASVAADAGAVTATPVTAPPVTATPDAGNDIAAPRPEYVNSPPPGPPPARPKYVNSPPPSHKAPTPSPKK